MSFFRFYLTKKLKTAKIGKFFSLSYNLKSYLNLEK